MSISSDDRPSRNAELSICAYLSGWIYKPAERKLPPSFRLHCLADANPSLNQLLTYAILCNSDEHIFLVFRGSVTVQDWLINLSFVPEHDSNYHSGIYNALKNSFDGIINHPTFSKATKLFVTGHSLGGGLAMMFSKIYENRDSPPELKLTYTFGAPMLKWSLEVQAADDKLHNYINSRDVVPQLPRQIKSKRTVEKCFNANLATSFIARQYCKWFGYLESIVVELSKLDLVDEYQHICVLHELSGEGSGGGGNNGGSNGDRTYDFEEHPISKYWERLRKDNLLTSEITRALDDHYRDKKPLTRTLIKNNLASTGSVGSYSDPSLECLNDYYGAEEKGQDVPSSLLSSSLNVTLREVSEVHKEQKRLKIKCVSNMTVNNQVKKKPRKI